MINSAIEQANVKLKNKRKIKWTPIKYFVLFISILGIILLILQIALYFHLLSKDRVSEFKIIKKLSNKFNNKDQFLQKERKTTPTDSSFLEVNLNEFNLTSDEYLNSLFFNFENKINQTNYLKYPHVINGKSNKYSSINVINFTYHHEENSNLKNPIGRCCMTLNRNHINLVGPDTHFRRVFRKNLYYFQSLLPMNNLPLPKQCLCEYKINEINLNRLNDLESSLFSKDQFRINCLETKCIISAISINGLLFAQNYFLKIFISSNFLNYIHINSFELSGEPSIKFRGVSLNAGGRFIPSNLFLKMIQLFSLSQVNVLKLKIFDNCRFAHSTTSSGLNQLLFGKMNQTRDSIFGFENTEGWSVEDVSKMIDLAENDYGVYIIPEFSLVDGLGSILPVGAYMNNTLIKNESKILYFNLKQFDYLFDIIQHSIFTVYSKTKLKTLSLGGYNILKCQHKSDNNQCIDNIYQLYSKLVEHIEKNTDWSILVDSHIIGMNFSFPNKYLSSKQQEDLITMSDLSDTLYTDILPSRNIISPSWVIGGGDKSRQFAAHLKTDQLVIISFNGEEYHTNSISFKGKDGYRLNHTKYDYFFQLNDFSGILIGNNTNLPLSSVDGGFQFVSNFGDELKISTTNRVDHFGRLISIDLQEFTPGVEYCGLDKNDRFGHAGLLFSREYDLSYITTVERLISHNLLKHTGNEIFTKFVKNANYPKYDETSEFFYGKDLKCFIQVNQVFIPEFAIDKNGVELNGQYSEDEARVLCLKLKKSCGGYVCDSSTKTCSVRSSKHSLTESKSIYEISHVKTCGVDDNLSSRKRSVYAEFIQNYKFIYISSKCIRSIHQGQYFGGMVNDYETAQYDNIEKAVKICNQVNDCSSVTCSRLLKECTLRKDMFPSQSITGEVSVSVSHDDDC